MQWNTLSSYTIWTINTFAITHVSSIIYFHAWAHTHFITTKFFSPFSFAIYWYILLAPTMIIDGETLTSGSSAKIDWSSSWFVGGWGGIISANSVSLLLLLPLPPFPAKLDDEAKVVGEIVGTTSARSRDKPPWSSSWILGGLLCRYGLLYHLFLLSWRRNAN